jgi:hypothetical protein
LFWPESTWSFAIFAAVANTDKPMPPLVTLIAGMALHIQLDFPENSDAQMAAALREAADRFDERGVGRNPFGLDRDG